MIFDGIKNGIRDIVKRVSWEYHANEPEILGKIGMVGIVLTAGLLIYETLKVETIVDDMSEEVKKIEEKPADEEKKSKELFGAYINGGVRVLLNYAPAIMFGYISMRCLVKSQDLFIEEKAALVGLIAASRKDAETMYQNIKDTFGEDVANQMRYGKDRKVLEVTNEPDGTQTTKEATIRELSDFTEGTFSRVFDKHHRFWDRSHILSLHTLNQCWAECRRILKSQGFITFNEILKIYGFTEDIEASEIGLLYGIVNYGEETEFDDGIRDEVKMWTVDFRTGRTDKLVLNWSNIEYLPAKMSLARPGSGLA